MHRLWRQLRVLREGRELAKRLLAVGPAAVPLDDDKSVNRTVDEALRAKLGIIAKSV